ncbi:MAG TPA: MarR family winged helix-turn-helix transcriptional regulator [Gemmatimonadaceae bacterium]|jgi:DNA-binding MarR family transcriptional regulator|nr:MarR family winged helix-turn-helix transcriptional regulator [Gemmatimonadaceae bacterium]
MPTESAALTCAAGTLRRATRAVSRLYDTHLARAGLTTTQYSLLVSLGRRRAPVPLTELAAEQVFERTSLYRALEPLRREKLIVFSAGPGRAKLVALTPRGERRAAEARPHWQAAQDAFLREFGRSAWSGLARDLTAMVEASRLVPAIDD